MGNILFEDHSARRFRPLSASVPTFEIRCGLFNTRERLELIDPEQGGLLLCRAELLALNTSPIWSDQGEVPSGRTLWLNGRLSPDADLVARLHQQRADDWAVVDEVGLLAASLSPELTSLALDSWRSWLGSTGPWIVPAEIRSLPQPKVIKVAELGWIWDIVGATSAAIKNDLALVGGGVLHTRHPFGVFSEESPLWSQNQSLRLVPNDAPPVGVEVLGAGGVYLGSGGVKIAAGVQLDTTDGPIVLDSGVRVMAHSYLAGPLYIGRESLVKPGARIFGESSFGVGCRLAGEIGESTFGDFTNKQHEGFIGHAVLGSWVNLGAMTTCSDLKNNYGEVRIDLGDGEVATGQRFIGLMLGDHVKTAIGTLFNTGTVVGFASNIFGANMPPKSVPSFSWGGAADGSVYDLQRAAGTAETVLGRRNCRWTDGHQQIFDFLHTSSAG